jgi:ATP-binding cassette subfamily B protein
MQMKQKTDSSIAWLWQVSGKNKYYILWLLLLQMMLGIADVMFAWLLRGIIDRAVAKDVSGFVRYVAAVTALTLFQLMMRAIVRFLVEYSKSTSENQLKSRLFQTLLLKDYAAVTAVHSGEWMNRLTSDTVVVAEGMTDILPEVAGMLVKLTGAVFLILYLLPQVAWILIPGGCLLVFLTYSFRKILKRLHKRIREADGRLRVFLSERLSSLLVVKSFAREEQTAKEALVKMIDHKKARMSRNHFSNICNIGFGIVMRGAYVGGAVYCGYGILTGTLTYGTFTAVLQLIGQIQSPFANISGYLPKYYAMTASCERLMEAEQFADTFGGSSDASADTPFGKNGCPLEQSEIKELYHHSFEKIRLEDAFFTYTPPVRGDEEKQTLMPVVLKKINLEVRKGEYIAFTGLSGCGKSTLLKLLMCLYPLDSGTRVLQLRHQKSIALDSRYIRLFAYVPQGNHLMSGRIRDVVTFGEEEACEREIWEALEIACAAEFVRELPDGVDTLLGERGLGLSEGQMQRIAIARAVYSDNPILVLDESTSALDEETEKQLLYHLKSMTDKTVLIVTHRPAILAICDRQVMMGEGEIIKILEKKEKRL